MGLSASSTSFRPPSSVAQRLKVEWMKEECLFGLLAVHRQH